jgi:hypothetical protein
MLRDNLGVDFNRYAEQLEHYGVSVDTDLTHDHAQRLICV